MMMRKYFKFISSLVLIPATKWYLRKKRSFNYNNVKVDVLPGVFHPGLFSSTLFILNFLEEKNLAEKKILELGCGSGLISIVSAKRGGKVIASDISDAAVKNTILNASQNKVDVDVIQSDLFDNLESSIFDLIIVNPPYYAKAPASESDFAWYCGENFEYFQKFFLQLPGHIKPDSEVIMVLTKGCDLQMIKSIATATGFSMQLIREKSVLFDEKDFLFSITKN